MLSSFKNCTYVYKWCTYLYDLSETENVSMILFTLRLPSFFMHSRGQSKTIDGSINLIIGFVSLFQAQRRGIEWGAYKQQIKEKLNNFTDDEYFTIA